MIALRDFLQGTSETALRKILRKYSLAMRNRTKEKEEERKRDGGRERGRSKAGQKVLFEIPSRFFAAFAWLHVCDGWKFLSSLFILSTVHLTLKRTNDSSPLRLSDSRSISRSHSCCVSSRFYTYSIIYFFFALRVASFFRINHHYTSH